MVNNYGWWQSQDLNSGLSNSKCSAASWLLAMMEKIEEEQGLGVECGVGDNGWILEMLSLKGIGRHPGSS